MLCKHTELFTHFCPKPESSSIPGEKSGASLGTPWRRLGDFQTPDLTPWRLPSHIPFPGFFGFSPNRFTVGVLNATLDLAALVLVGAVGFLGSEVVLSPVVSHCLRLSPFMWGVGVGWCGRLLGL